MGRSKKAIQPVAMDLTAIHPNAAGIDIGNANRDRGKPRGLSPPTPPDMRVRIRRFGELSHFRTVNRGIPSESK